MRLGRWLVLALILVCAGIRTGAQTIDLVQSHLFGGGREDFGYSVQATMDGGFIVAGITASFGAGDRDVWLIKFSAMGNMQWDRTYGGIYDDMGRYCTQTSDSGFIITGTTQSSAMAKDDVWLIKTDSNGDMLWSQVFGGSENDLGSCVQQALDGGYVILGRTESFGNGSYDFWLIRTSATGHLIWEQTYGGNADDLGYTLHQTPDGGFLLAGYTGSYGAGMMDLWLIQTDELGQEQWSRTYGGRHDDYGASVDLTSDGGYIIAGETHSFGNDAGDAWLIKTDLLGQAEWSKTFGGNGCDGAFPAAQSNDGGFIMVGWTESYGTGDSDIWLIKTDETGAEMLNATYGGPGMDWGLGLQETPDGRCLITGFEYNGLENGFDLALIDDDLIENGIGGSGGDTPPQRLTLYSAYPNPFNDQTTLSFDLTAESDITMDVFDIRGRPVQALARGRYDAGNYRIPFEADNLPSGVYIIRLLTDGQLQTRKCQLLR